MKCFNDYDHDHKEFYKVKPHSELKVLESDTTEGRYRVTYEVDCLSCEQVWIDYQDEAYEIIAPGGRLIHDPLQRNRAINAAYARLWLHDNRFQWAGLAAFASKQVGCGLLHATDVVMKMQAEDEAAKRLLKSTRRLDAFGLSLSYADDEALREYQLASEQNPMWTKDISPTWSFGTTAGEVARQTARESVHATQSALYKQMQKGFRYVRERLAFGNTLLFLDVYPLHMFYAKRGLTDLKMCLRRRENIVNLEGRKVYWPAPRKPLESVLDFGLEFKEVVWAFEAIERGDIAGGVDHLARHEQVNILQPVMYSDWRLVSLLRGNQVSYVTNLPKSVAQPVELTLANQCESLNDDRTIGFDGGIAANLADREQRMEFVLRAARQFDDLLKGPARSQVEQAIKNIAEVDI